MPNWSTGVGGAAAGAGAGAAIGSVVPGIGTGIGAIGGGLIGGLTGLFGGGNDDAIQEQIRLWQQAIAEMQNDPNEKAALAKLEGLTTTGLTDQERAEMLQAALGAGNLARSREGAIANTAAARGGGVSTSGMTAANQDLAAQGAAQQYAGVAQQAAGQASQRRTAAIEAYNQELDRREQLMNSARQGLSGAYGNEQQYNSDQALALTQGLAVGGSAAAAAAKLGQPSPVGAPMPDPSKLQVNPTGWAFDAPASDGFSAYPNKPGYGSLNSYFYGGG